MNCDGSCINDTDNDGVCNENEVLGCTDPTACNYNAEATDDNGACTYPTQTYLNCDGSCINDSNSNGICDEQEVLGCTEPSALNYNPNATTDDGTCIPVIFGCSDQNACNYDAAANTDDGSCVYPVSEVCNDLDDDCDGEVDEFVQSIFYADLDLDGYGNALDFVLACQLLDGYVTNNQDCNDEDFAAYPGAVEICGNNRDEDCNGIDSLCSEIVLGCTDIGACNYDFQATEDDGSCIYPQLEICNELDDNCNGQIDEGLTAGDLNVSSVVTALYPVCSGNSLKSANLNTGSNSSIIEGNGNDLWFSFSAEYNVIRAGLSAATGDNDVRLYTTTDAGCLLLLETEHEITTGNQVLLSDQLTVGQTYYVAVHNISGPMNASAKICFNHLTGSDCDHYYSNNTGIYTSVCNSFKAQFRSNAAAYIFDVISASQSGINIGITPWSYTTPNSNSVVSRLGSILPANQSGSSIVYTLKVPVLYSLFDAAGNFENLLAQPNATCTITLNRENTVALRLSDRCPTSKSLTSTIAPDRTVCGAMRYDWEFTQVLPTSGTAQVVQGGAYASVFFLSNVPGITVGKTYNVRVRPVHSSGTVGQWGTAHCLRVGSSGMVMQSENESGSVENIESRVSGISVYPNPTATGSFVIEYNGARRGELIFAQESMTELVMMDITGKIVFKTNIVLNGNATEINFGDLESGLYLIDFGGERTRIQVMK